MTRRELARLAGCRANTITDYLNAKSEMRSDLLTKVFEIMKIKIEGSQYLRKAQGEKEGHELKSTVSPGRKRRTRIKIYGKPRAKKKDTN